MTLARRTFKGVAQLFVGQIGQQAIMLGSTVVLARVLTPEDFGAVAIAMSVMVILQLIGEMGIATAIVQRRAVDVAVTDTAFWLTVVTALPVCVGLVVLAGPVAAFYKVPVLRRLLVIVAIAYLFRGFSGVPRALLLRDIRGKALAANGVALALAQAVTAIPLALSGVGAASMIWGACAGEAVSAILCFVWTSYRPRSLGRVRDIKPLVTFGVWISTGRVIANISARLDPIIIGRLLDAKLVGLYNMAQRVSSTIPSMIGSVVNTMTLPMYSQLQDDKQATDANYWMTLEILSLVCLPTCALAYLLADPCVPLIFGHQWADSAPIVRILSIGAAVSALGGGIFSSIVYAAGKPQWTTVMSIFRLATLPVFLIVGTRWHLVGVAWAETIWQVAGRLFNQYILSVQLGYSVRKYLHVVSIPLALNIAPTLLALMLLNVLERALGDSVGTQLGVAAVGTLVWIGTYALLCWTFARSTTVRVVGFVRSALLRPVT
jgi:lipopolysaccharide exporter